MTGRRRTLSTVLPVITDAPGKTLARTAAALVTCASLAVGCGVVPGTAGGSGDGTITVMADNYNGKKFNAPNDLTMDSRGRIYFTDPRYGSREGIEQFDEEGNEIEGVYRIDAPGKVVRIITHEVHRPNGIAISPDYIGDTAPGTVFPDDCRFSTVRMNHNARAPAAGRAGFGTGGSGSRARRAIPQ